tara:strand:- start:7512 stop:7724 length:213 start_codon:yes stop_codon:yes gene_type:complete
MEYEDIKVDSKLEKYLEKSIVNMEKEFSIKHFKKMLIEKISGHPKLHYDEKYLILDKYITHKFAKNILFD